MLVLSHRIRNPGSVPILKGLSSEMEGGIKVVPFLYHLPSHWAFPFIMDPQKNKCVPEKLDYKKLVILDRFPRRRMDDEGIAANTADSCLYRQKVVPVHYTGIRCTSKTFCPYRLDQLSPASASIPSSSILRPILYSLIFFGDSL